MSTRKLWKPLCLYAIVFCVSIGSACFAVDSSSSLSDANWLSMEFPSSSSGSISATTCDSSGNLYIGGSFMSKGDNPVPFGVAKWNGTEWTAFLSGAGDSVSVSSVVYSSGTIYAAGSFTSSADSATFSFAKWGGTKWIPLGTDYGSFNVITCDSSGNLYASGKFKTASDVSFSIGKWNVSTSTWIPLGTDYGYPNALVCDSSKNLYAGGLLSDGTNTFSVAKWNGTKWSPLGTLSGTLMTLAFDSSGNLYAGGMFSDGANAFGVAKWDSLKLKWNIVGGTGLEWIVKTLAFDSSGNLYAGGRFITIADGVPANYIARWNGSTWSAIGSGTGGDIGEVNALSYSSSSSVKTLYVGGAFTTAGGKSSNHIAKLIPSAAPGEPRTVTAERGDTRAIVKFTPPVSNGGFVLTSYEVISNPDGIKATGSASPIAVTRLTNGKSYTFTVKATNAIGPFGPASTASNSVTPATIPDAPTKVIASPGIGQASVAFTLPFNGGSAITGYTVTSDPEGILKTGTTSPITVSGLTNGVAYTFFVTATNSLGTSEPSDASASATPAIPITAIGAISGTAKVGSVLTAGTVTPTGATVKYQWMRCASSSAATGDSIGENQKTYTVIADDSGKFIKVKVTGIGNYDGSVTSTATAVVFMPSEILSISPTSRRDVRMGMEFIAGNVLPATATFTYQWSYCSESASGTYRNVTSGGTSNTVFYPGSEKYFKVTVTGIGIYSGSVTSEPVYSIAAAITNIGAISGAVKVDSVLTAGAVSPARATVNYDWQTASAAAGTWTSTGITTNTYTVAAGDKTKYIRVVATGIGNYINSVTSAVTTAVPTPITVLPTISGTAKVGQILTATATPSGVTVSCQWKRCDTSGDGDTGVSITGAIAKTYTLAAGDVNKYIKVETTGIGSYSGTTLSTATAAVSPISVGSITAITGTAKVGSVLTAGAVTPSAATVTCQWTSCTTAGGTYENIDGAKAKTYTVGAAELTKFIKVVATGTDGYRGSTTSAATTAVVNGSLTTIGAISGTVNVGSVLTAGALAPAAAPATATYQWQSSSAATGPWTSIGDSSGTYTIKNDDVGMSIRVKATASGYTGEVTSLATKAVPTPITEPTIDGNAAVGQILTAKATPSGATVSYQWKRCDTSGDGDTGVNIPAAIAQKYTPLAADTAKFIKVVTTGFDKFSGTTLSAATTAVSPISVTDIAAITGKVNVGSVLTAGAVTPPVATVKYQWTSCTTVGGTYENISGATLKTYTLGAAEVTKFIKVVAIGTDGYSGSATSVATTAVFPAPITAIGVITGTVNVGSVLTAGALTPAAASATATYQWESWSANILKVIGDSNTYTIKNDDVGKVIMVTASATGYNRNVTSAATKVVPTPITAPTIGGETTVGQILSAAATPSGATVTYQWKRCDTSGDGDTGVNIPAAIAQKYTLLAADTAKYIKVVTTGFDKFSGTMLSTATTAVSPISVTDIAAITGTVKVGSVLTAGAVTPSAATVKYQWTSCTTVDGTYENISGAILKTYTVGAAEVTKFIKVVAIGTVGYGGSATSAATTAVPKVTVTEISAIIGTAKVGSVLTAGTVTPAGATVTYDWQTAPAASGAWTSTGIKANTYTVAEGVKYIRVVATGTDNYTSSATSTSITTNLISITNIGNIIGTMSVGSVLTAGPVTPAGATVTYDWKTSSDHNTMISTGVKTNTYKVEVGDAGKELRVVATGTDSYVGTAGSKIELVLIPITGIGEITCPSEIVVNLVCALSAGKLTPDIGLMANYQWSSCDTIDGTYVNISGESETTYEPTAAVATKYIKVTASGSPQTGYSGSVTSAAVGPVKYHVKITAIGAITGTAKVDSVLTTGAVTPTGATVTYDWQTASAVAGTWTSTGITTNTYTVAAGDKTKYIRVVATGKDILNKTSTATSTEVGPVPTPIDSIGDITGSDFKVGVQLTAGAVAPVTATVNCQWSSCGTVDGTYVNIPGATLKIYTLKASDVTKYLKVTATGKGIYSGSVKSNPTATAITASITAIGAITGTAKVGYTLTVGALTPTGVLTPAVATATYQWMICSTASGTYSNIDGATKKTYIPVASDATKFLKVVATGDTNYPGTITSVATTAIAAAVPDAPTIGTATPGNARVEVSFTTPSSDGGSPITLYTVTSIPGAKTATGTATPITVTGLTNGTTYTFTVKATNAVGIGPASAASNPVMPVATPIITANPANRSVMEGDPATFKVTVSGTPTPTCLWQVSTDGAVTWSDLKDDDVYTGVTTATMTVINTTLAMSRYQYRCKMDNIGGSAPSNAAILRVESYDTDLAGTDDFSTDENWSAPTMSTSKGGLLTFIGDSLEYTVSSPSSENFVLREWTANVGSYSKNWEVQVDVHLAGMELLNGQYANLNLFVVNAADATNSFASGMDNMCVAIDRYNDGLQTVYNFEGDLNSYYTGNNTGLLEIEATSTDAALRISFNCETKELSSWYATNINEDVLAWTLLQKVNIGSGEDYDWGMNNNSTFAVFLLGGAGGGTDIAPVSVSTGNAYFSNFLASTDAANYLVIDLSDGPDALSYPISYLPALPDPIPDEYRKTKLAMKKINAGIFTMGSPADEFVRGSGETQHQVTLTKDFYIGVFEVTQKQWERVMGNWPSYFNNIDVREVRPVEQVSYNDIRGSTAGAGWPRNSNVDATSFMGKLRKKTGIEAFDLPTEAQWEYACRANTSTALNNGTNLVSGYQDANMDLLGRYYYNGGSSDIQGVGLDGGTAKVGSYRPNAWGLYDMHGNNWEWCLDWYASSYPGTVTEPPGPASSSLRILRGGALNTGAGYCRSAIRSYSGPAGGNYSFSFRLLKTGP